MGRSRRSQFNPSRKRRAAHLLERVEVPEQDEPEQEELGVGEETGNSKWSSAERFAMFAMLAWTYDYSEVVRAEAALYDGDVGDMVERHSSGYAQRMMRAGGDSSAVRARIEDRMTDTAAALWRSRHVNNIPFMQAVKAVSFTYSRASHVHWVRDRKLRRVAGRPFAHKLLTCMADTRPPPSFEVCPHIVSIAFDQTYVRKSGVSTGASRYSAVQTVDAQGEVKAPERIVYINGQDFPAPANVLSAAARAQIAVAGPYTQDFYRVIPHLQPDRIDGFMDTLLVRAVQLVAGAAQPGFLTLDLMKALFSRPNHDPGGATYVTFMPSLLNCDTKSYLDMFRIIDWMVRFKMVEALVLHVIGDGQSVLRMRDLKRKFPEYYFNVLVSNGHFHSSAHFQFATCRMWWLALMCQCCTLLGKDKVGPDIKDLESNSYQHTKEVCCLLCTPPPPLFLHYLLPITSLPHTGD
jgi:hypothetical protein